MSAPPGPSTFLQQLLTIKANYLNQMVALTAAMKPDYNVDGQGVQWMQYQMAILERAIAQINRLIQIEGGAFEQTTQAFVSGGDSAGYGLGP